MRRIVALLALAAVVCACTATWTVPPGTEEDTMFGAFLGAENRIMADIMKYGFPDTGMLRYREGYVLSYDARNRAPHWVAERLNAKRLAPGTSRKGMRFRKDSSLDEPYRSSSKDYVKSGYVRGRMAAAANHYNDRVALLQTFYLSNASPQLGRAFRQNFWVHLEQRVRDWARESSDLYVVTGPLYLPEKGADGKTFVRYEVIGENRVAVPTHFFKVMLREQDGRAVGMQAFLVPHEAIAAGTPYEKYLVTVDEVERVAGLDFFSELSEPTQSRMEAGKPDKVWPLASAPTETATP